MRRTHDNVQFLHTVYTTVPLMRSEPHSLQFCNRRKHANIPRRNRTDCKTSATFCKTTAAFRREPHKQEVVLVAGFGLDRVFGWTVVTNTWFVLVSAVTELFPHSAG